MYKSVTLIFFLLLFSACDKPSNAFNHENDKQAPSPSETEILVELENTLSVLKIKPQNLTIGSWSAQTGNQALVKFKLEENIETRKENSKVLRVDIESIGEKNAWDVQVVEKEYIVIPHEIYVYSVWVKGTAGAEAAFNVESLKYQTIVHVSTPLTGDWQHIAFQFSTAEEKVRTPIHLSFNYNVGATIYIEEASIEMEKY